MGNACSDKNAPEAKGGLNIRQTNGKPNSAQGPAPAFECKVVVLGDSAVGKTSIAMRFIEDKFSESHVVTLAAKFQQPKVHLKSGTTVKINLWDTSGEEKFRSVLPIYFKNINGAILTYSINDKLTFDSVRYWLAELDKHVKKEDVALYLVGNKKDLPDSERKIETRTAQKLAEEHGMLFTEVSAKTGEGVNEVFRSLAEELVKKIKP